MIRKITTTALAALAIVAVLAVSGCAETGATQQTLDQAAATKSKHSKKQDGGSNMESVSQANARQAAEDYLSTMPFSRDGLIEQLSSKAGSGFSKSDAIYAADAVHANWNAQAVLAAKQYLDTMSFSRDGLIEQLESKAGAGFTHAQAVHGVDATGL
jgi:hypothetical protein